MNENTGLMLGLADRGRHRFKSAAEPSDGSDERSIASAYRVLACRYEALAAQHRAVADALPDNDRGGRRYHAGLEVGANNHADFYRKEANKRDPSEE